MLSFGGPDGLGMELHALDAKRAMAEAHDLVFRCASADFEAFGHRIPFDDQRMVAHRVERTWNRFEDGLAVVEDRRGLAMHQARCADDPSAKRFADALMAEADAEDRQLRRKLTQDRHRDAGFFRRARAGRDHNRVGSERARTSNVDRIVAPDDDFGSQLAEVLDEVVGKRVVVVDHQQPDFSIAHRIFTWPAYSPEAFNASRAAFRIRAPLAAPAPSRAPC